MVLSEGHKEEVLVMMEDRGMVVKASVRSKWIMVWSGWLW